MLDLLVRWRLNGGSRHDRDLDGKIDDPGTAIMDASWPLLESASDGESWFSDRACHTGDLRRRADSTTAS
jgi:hypothetical protein